MAQKQLMLNDCVVAVTIEMGHHANFRKEPSAHGFTHDWTVFVRGFEGSMLEYFVEKVVFKLHNTFKNPIRVITEPPFRITESGYGGFTLPIEIHFKNKQTPRNIIFSYELFLNTMGSPPIINIRCEKLKFSNPTPEFKALLIKAGGIEQGSEHPSSDLLSSLRSQNMALPNMAKENEKVKVKRKKNKSKQQFKSTSPLPSLSPMSSDNEDSYTAPPPPPPVRKEKELSVKKESSSSTSSQPNQDYSSSHRGKSKHRSTSSTSSHKERPDKDTSHKSHKYRDKTKERDRSSSHKDKDVVKKDREANSQKVVKENFEARKEREGSHSSGKSSTSSSQLDNKIAVHVSHKEREKSLPSKDKDTLGSSKEKLHSSSKDREKLPKEKHSSHKDVSLASHSEPKKTTEDISKEKASKETDRHHKNHKRHVESADNFEREKLKSSSVERTEEKSVKVKSSSGKENYVSRDSKEKEPSKEVVESKSLSSDKRKHKKNRHSKKQRQSHSSETKQTESAEKLSEIPQHENLTPSLAVTANFQPQLLSPFKSKSDEEESPTEQNNMKSILNKQSEQSTSSQNIVSNESVVEKQQKKVDHGHSKYGAKKFRKSKKKSTTEHTDVQQCYGLDTLAPNGMSIGELVAINEQIVKAQRSSNRKLLKRVIRIIGETGDFDIGDVFLSFDICSVDKAVVLQIQALFRER